MTRRKSLALVLVVAAIWRFAFFFSIQNTVLAELHTWSESDMATFLAQARRIADGDWLATPPYYPYHSWMKPAPREEWAQWHPPQMFYQPPLYSYALAGVMKTGLPPVTAMTFLQLLLGVCSCGLMFGIASRVFGRSAGLAAGLLLATYGPLIASESQLLRDGPILLWMLLILWLAVDTFSLKRRNRLSHSDWRWRTWLLGVLLGMQAMLHEAAIFLFISVTAIGQLVAFHAHARNRNRNRNRDMTIEFSNSISPFLFIAILFLGALAGYSPLLARNIAVGAPPGPKYFGSAQAFALANSPETSDESLSIDFPENPATLSARMRDAQGSVPKLAISTLRDFGPNWPSLFKRWLLRLLALADPYEIPENISYDFCKSTVPILAFAVDFRFLLPLALAGATMLGWRRWRKRLAGPLGLLLIQGLSTVGLVSLVYPFGRYRLMFLPLVAPLAGSAVAGLCAALRTHDTRLAIRLMVTFGFFSLLQFSVTLSPAIRIVNGPRSAEFVLTSRFLTRSGYPDRAVTVLEEAQALFPDDELVAIEFALNRGIVFQQAGNYEAAIVEYQKVLSLEPNYALAQRGLATSREHRPLN